MSSSLTYGEPVLYLDFEDTPASIVGRLLALGTDPETIVARLDYLRPCDPFEPEALNTLLNVREYRLAVLDGVTEAYALLGLDPWTDAARFLAALPRPIAERGAAVVEVDHVVKSKESRGRWPIGGQHKLAGVAAAFSSEVIRQPSRTDAGLVKLTVQKDRHGHVRSHAEGSTIALVHIVPENGGERVSVLLEPPDATAAEDGTFRPTVLMARVASYVEDKPGASLNDIRRGVKGKGEHKDLALRLLVAEGWLERRSEGRAHRHYSVHPFDENADRVPVSPSVSHRVPDTVRPIVSSCPPSAGGDTDTGSANGHGSLEDRVRAISAMANEQEQAKAWRELEESNR